MGFWMTTLSSAIGAFVGILGAVIIARWQMNKSHKLDSIQYYLQFNNAQIHINRFVRKVKRILEYTENERAHARILLSKVDFNNFVDFKFTVFLIINSPFGVGQAFRKCA